MSVNRESSGPESLGTEVLQLTALDQPNGAKVLRASGEIDTLTAPQFDAYLHDQADGVRLLVLDLSGVEFLGSAGLAVLVKVKQRADSSDQALRLVCGSRIVRRALSATGLDELFEIAESVPHALSGG